MESFKQWLLEHKQQYNVAELKQCEIDYPNVQKFIDNPREWLNSNGYGEIYLDWKIIKIYEEEDI